MQFMEAVAHVDQRGSLTALNLPFAARRAFYISDVPYGAARGNHAHRKCDQFIVCIRGTFNVGDGKKSTWMMQGDTFRVKPMTWLTLDAFSPEAIALVFCSDPYDPDDYIRDRKVWEALA
jgi:UDP-2-acetamido-3-amino-2,3-dideoxy-glucuronate N-acetyltransferase